MRLDYKILWFEDEKEWYEAILTDISEFLTENGFTMVSHRQPNGSDIDKIVEENDYDLILIDYNLLGEYGDALIEKIREHKIFTDIVFYSQSGEMVVRDAAKAKGLDGVFCADRKQDMFLEKVFKVIKSTIKKVVDLNNIRGLIMASTSELDIQMEDVIQNIIQVLPPEVAVKQKATIKKKFIDSLKDRIKILVKLDIETDFENLIKKLESYHKWRAVKRICGQQNELKNYEEILTPYQKEIIDKRNILAHICEEVDENGNKILKSTLSGYEDYEFNEVDAIQIRIDLRKYSEIFYKILESIQQINQSQ